MIAGRLVTLRALRPQDYARLTEFKNDLEFELLGGGRPPQPVSQATVAEFFDRAGKDKDNISFAIEASGLFIGDCGLFNIDRPGATAEVGIGIGDRDYWGKGYGRDAMCVLADYGFRIQNLRKLWLTTHGSNLRAIRSYEAVGFVEEGRQREQVWSNGRYEDLIAMALFRADFQPSRD